MRRLGARYVKVLFGHLQNHVYREVWPATPHHLDAGRHFWAQARAQVNELSSGGGGGMKRVGRLAGDAAAEEAAVAGADSAAQEAARLQARKQVEAQLRKATTAPSTREHLYQTGEYQLQDVLLGEVRNSCVGGEGGEGGGWSGGCGGGRRASSCLRVCGSPSR